MAATARLNKRKQKKKTPKNVKNQTNKKQTQPNKKTTNKKPKNPKQTKKPNKKPKTTQKNPKNKITTKKKGRKLVGRLRVQPDRSVVLLLKREVQSHHRRSWQRMDFRAACRAVPPWMRLVQPGLWSRYHRVPAAPGCSGAPLPAHSRQQPRVPRGHYTSKAA